jgi:hypothetical protein
LTRTTIFQGAARTESPTVPRRLGRGVGQVKATITVAGIYVAQYEGDATYAATDSPKKALKVQ